ncbi:MAG: NUDIX domain-containing protein [Hyphomicrobium sp.]
MFWQLPQGGIEPREPSREAAFRELWEETGVRSASLIGEIPAGSPTSFRRSCWVLP